MMARNPSKKERTRGVKPAWILVGVGLAAAALALWPGLWGEAERSRPLGASAVQGLSPEELVEAHRSIRLEPGQDRIMRAALEGLPAPCCDQFPAATCCCECNLARSIWGLSKILIAERGAAPGEVRRGVERWLADVRPGGFSGDACPKGRCGAPMSQDGCGGMDPEEVSL